MGCRISMAPLAIQSDQSYAMAFRASMGSEKTAADKMKSIGDSESNGLSSEQIPIIAA